MRIAIERPVTEKPVHANEVVLQDGNHLCVIKVHILCLNKCLQFGMPNHATNRNSKSEFLINLWATGREQNTENDTNYIYIYTYKLPEIIEMSHRK